MTATEPVTIQRATEGDISQLAKVVAAAFLHLAPSEWLVGDLRMRTLIFPDYFGLYVEHGLREGVVYTTADREAVGIWLPAGAAPLPEYEHRLAAVVGPDRVERFLTFDRTLEAQHPTEPDHDWLAILAVRPPRQNRGIGTALLAHYHRELDRLHRPAYLEAANEADRDWYCHRGWYELAGRIILPPNGPRMYPMWRDPGPVVPA